MILKETWYWFWGFDQSNTQIHSTKLEFTDFDKMKEYSAKHSHDHQWVGEGYWSDYDKLTKSKNEGNQWIKLENSEFSTVRAIIEKSTPFHVENSMPVASEFYLINSNVIKFDYVNVESELCEYKENLYILSASENVEVNLSK